jgi:hypothetical protein
MRGGITTIESLAGLFWLALLLVLVFLWGAWGIVAWTALTVAILAIGNVLYRYYVEPIVELDSVPCGRCGQANQYQVERQGKCRIWRCACGAEYSFAGPTLRMGHGTQELRPYMRWKWWGKGRWRAVGSVRSE